MNIKNRFKRAGIVLPENLLSHFKNRLCVCVQKST